MPASQQHAVRGLAAATPQLEDRGSTLRQRPKEDLASISHSGKSKFEVKILYSFLKVHGFNVWLDGVNVCSNVNMRKRAAIDAFRVMIVRAGASFAQHIVSCCCALRLYCRLSHRFMLASFPRPQRPVFARPEAVDLGLSFSPCRNAGRIRKWPKVMLGAPSYRSTAFPLRSCGRWA